MTPKVPDPGHREADKELYALTRRLNISYRQARIDLQEKIEKYMEQFEKEDTMMRALYDSGELSHEDYMAWRMKKIAGTKQWRNMLEQLSQDLTHQNQIAASMINDTLPDVYAINHNYGTFEAEVGSGYDTTYTMYDRFTVKKLLTEHEGLLPQPSVDIPKDLLWNRQHLQSAVLQGILSGESMPEIAKRFQEVTSMTEKAAIRNARTAVTGAENAGRIDSYIRAESMGIKMKQMWMATLDGRTRDSHAILDGQQQEVGKKFSNGCRYPGDPQGAPGEIFNCRCSLVAIVEGADPYNPNLRPSEYLKEQGLTYEQWKEMHGERYYSQLFSDMKENDTLQQPSFHIAQGKDISDSWIRRPDQFAFEIEDVINAQGFDGLPRVVSQAEFDKYVKQANSGNGFIAQRTYSAPDQETLDLYRDQLYHGKWYVDCSNGGAALGQGMYSVYANGTTVTDYMTKEMNAYKQRRGAEYNYLETFTLTPDAKTITPEEISKLRQDYKDNIIEKFNGLGGWGNPDAIKWASEHDISNKFDDGTFAALLGYDAIISHGIDDYAVILNRTKVIFMES